MGRVESGYDGRIISAAYTFDGRGPISTCVESRAAAHRMDTDQENEDSWSGTSDSQAKTARFVTSALLGRAFLLARQRGVPVRREATTRSTRYTDGSAPSSRRTATARDRPPLGPGRVGAHHVEAGGKCAAYEASNAGRRDQNLRVAEKRATRSPPVLRVRRGERRLRPRTHGASQSDSDHQRHAGTGAGEVKNVAILLWTPLIHQRRRSRPYDHLRTRRHERDTSWRRRWPPDSVGLLRRGSSPPPLHVRHDAPAGGHPRRCRAANGRHEHRSDNVGPGRLDSQTQAAGPKYVTYALLGSVFMLGPRPGLRGLGKRSVTTFPGYFARTCARSSRRSARSSRRTASCVDGERRHVERWARGLRKRRCTSSRICT
jgi:hypothetical protein